MKKFLLTGACLAVLTGPAFACPAEQYNSLMEQAVTLSSATDAIADKCSPTYFAQMERQIALWRQAIPVMARMKSDKTCTSSGGKGPEQALQATLSDHSRAA